MRSFRLSHSYGQATAKAAAVRFLSDKNNQRSGGEDSKDAAPAARGAGASFAQQKSAGEGEQVRDVLRDPGSVYTHTVLSTPRPPTGVAKSSTPQSSLPKGHNIFLRSTPTGAASGAGDGGATRNAGTSAASASEKDALLKKDPDTSIKTAARPQDGPMVPDYGPLRATGLWSVDEVIDHEKKTVDFRRIDDIESELMMEQHDTDEALVPYEEEQKWKNKLMFVHKFKKTPKHLTWKELGEEIECMDCTIDLDEHRPEEIFTISFYFTDKKTATRDLVWSARNDVSYSEGFTDLLAAVGACLGRSDVHRTIRFDDGVGVTRDLSIRKRSRFTSDITLAFRPQEKYDKFGRKAEVDEFEMSMEKDGMSTWGFHPSLMDPEYNELDYQDPEGTYEVAISAHAFCFVFLKAINRLLARPMKEFYRPSQLVRTAKIRTDEDIGVSHAIKGWMGIDEQVYPHYTPIEAIQEHWLGADAPFSLCAMVNKLREMDYLKRENPEYQSWLSVRERDTKLAIRNMGVKLLGVGASTLFLPVAHNTTVNRLLPKVQQRRIESRISVNAVLGLPDETRRIEEFKQITGHARLTGASADPSTSTPANDTTPTSGNNANKEQPKSEEKSASNQ